MGDKLKHIFRLVASSPAPRQGLCHLGVFRMRVWLEIHVPVAIFRSLIDSEEARVSRAATRYVGFLTAAAIACCPLLSCPRPFAVCEQALLCEISHSSRPRENMVPLVARNGTTLGVSRCGAAPCRAKMPRCGLAARAMPKRTGFLAVFTIYGLGAPSVCR